MQLGCPNGSRDLTPRNVRGFFAVGQFSVRKNINFVQIRFDQVRLGQIKLGQVRFFYIFVSYGELSYGEKSQSPVKPKHLNFKHELQSRDTTIPSIHKCMCRGRYLYQYIYNGSFLTNVSLKCILKFTTLQQLRIPGI